MWDGWAVGKLGRVGEVSVSDGEKGRWEVGMGSFVCGLVVARVVDGRARGW